MKSAVEVRTEIYRRMTPGERWKEAERLYWAARALKAAHLRALHPTWSEEEIERQVRAIFMHVPG